MFESYIRQLKSDQVLERRQAIVKITNSGHPEALALLEKFLRIEKDDEIRGLTEKAIQYLKTNKPAASSLATSSQVGHLATTSSQMKKPVAQPAMDKRASGVLVMENRGAASTPASAPPLMAQMIPPKPITEQQKKLAKGKLDAAMQFHMNGKIDQALLALRRAFELNPALERDGFAHGLASALTGGGGDPIELVKIATKPKDEETKAIVKEGATTALTFGIELAIITIIFIMYFAIAYRKFAEIADALAQFALASGAQSSVSFSALDLFTGSTRQTLLVSALTQGFSVTISSLIQAFLMFVVGILIGGTGNILDFLRTIMRVTAGIYLAIGLVFLVFPANAWLPYDPVTRQAIGFSPFILLAIIGLVGAVLWVYFAGRAHGFGFFKGCAMIALTGIGFTILVMIVTMLAAPRMAVDAPSIIIPLVNMR
jgi:tetratricopeptide (TPR) repeat protein